MSNPLCFIQVLIWIKNKWEDANTVFIQYSFGLYWVWDWSGPLLYLFFRSKCLTVLPNVCTLTYLISPLLISPVLLKPTWQCNFSLDGKQLSLGKTCESGLWGLTVFCINMKYFLKSVTYKGIYPVQTAMSQEYIALNRVIFTAKWIHRCFVPCFSYMFCQSVVLQHCWQRHGGRCVGE